MLYEEDFPNILFPVDGDIFDIEGKQCIVIGVAYSVDKFYRLRMGYNWWPDEQPTPTIKEYVEQQCKAHPVDVVFSHTCPLYVGGRSQGTAGGLSRRDGGVWAAPTG